MSHFPNAFKKVFVVTDFLNAGATKTHQLTKNQFAFYDFNTWALVPTAEATQAQHPLVRLVAGNPHTVDVLGDGFNGGLKESIKSQGINPAYIHRIWKVKARGAKNNIIRVGYDGVTDATAPQFVKDRSYHLRVDAKGTPVMSSLLRNLYVDAIAYTGCAGAVAGELKDPVTVMLQWAKELSEHPYFKHFVTVQVKSKVGAAAETVINPATYTEEKDQADIPAIKASLTITGAYTDTTFSRYSFDRNDRYLTEPVYLYASLRDETGGICQFDSIKVTEVQAARIAQGSGGKVLRDVILHNEYLAERWSEDARVREAGDIDAITLDYVNQAGTYDTFNILHSVPRKGNPSSVLDSDQYHLQIVTPAGTDLSDLEAWLTSYVGARGIVIEDLSGDVAA
jgi:hypothetical protein